MQGRRVFYIAVLALVAWYVFHSSQAGPPATDAISKKEILAAFANHADDLWISFPQNYSGEANNDFYLGETVADQPTTTVYRIVKNEEGQLVYEVRDQWDNVKLPANQFETYVRVNGDWIKQKEI